MKKMCKFNMFVSAVCFCCLFIFDQTTMDQEQKCLTSLSFDLSFFFNQIALCSIGIVSFVFIVSTITSSRGIIENKKSENLRED